MIHIDEILPPDPLASAVVLHVRLHLRHSIRNREPSAPNALAMLFGFAWEEGGSAEWKAAAAEPKPLLAGALLTANLQGNTSGVVGLGHDDRHLAECKRWLSRRKDADNVFERIVATDLATLLELSKARDMAVAMGQDEEGERRPLPVLIQGETGSGKELLARAIHSLWRKASGNEKAPFQVVHVAGMTDDLINDELFGHVKGAYTGAESDRIGRIEAAYGGSLLIDEVGDLPQSAQLRLLRFLQTQKLSRTGENKERPVKVRVIAATWHDLEELIKQGRFRLDLFHRLRMGSSLMLPPLAEREGLFLEVVPQLLRNRGHTANPLLTRSARDALQLFKWSGNLRELVGVLEQALSLAGNGTLRLEHLPAHIQQEYLARPLYERIHGFLSDEFEEQELSEEHIRWRIEKIDQSLRQAVKVQGDPEIEEASRFLSSLGIQTQDQQKAIRDVATWRELDQQCRTQDKMVELWGIISKFDLPDLVRQVLEKTEVQAREQAEMLSRRKRELEPQIKAQLDENPWWTILEELRGLPFFQQIESDNKEGLGGFIAYMVNLMSTLAPREVNRFGAEVKRRGGFFKVLHDQSLESGTSDSAESRAREEHKKALENEPANARKRPNELSKEEWEAIAKKYPTQADAHRETGFDPKTLGKYFARFGIPSPWARDLPDDNVQE